MALILTPTPLEQARLTPCVPSAEIRVCGFGLAVAGIRATQWITRLRPNRVVLVGIAGSLVDRLAVGRAYWFQATQCWGIGVGAEPRHSPAAEMGWPQLQDGEQTVHDRLSLHGPAGADDQAGGTLLSVAAAAIGPDEARGRSERFPDAGAEDMEAFAVAAACFLADVPLVVIRGVSNRAGDRNHTEWRIDAALRAAAELTERVLYEEGL